MDSVTSILGERQLSLIKLARQHKVNVATCWRWSRKGIRGVKLETILLGGKRITSHEAFARFVAATTHATLPKVTPVHAPHQLGAAKRDLSKSGNQPSSKITRASTSNAR